MKSTKKINFTMKDLTPYTAYPWIVQALLVRMKKSSSSVLICLWRFSVGMRGSQICSLSRTELQTLTKMPESSVQNGLKDLMAMGIIKRLNKNSLQRAQWKIILPNPSKIDPSKFDPSFLDGRIRQILRGNPSKFAPQSSRNRKLKENIKRKAKGDGSKNLIKEADENKPAPPPSSLSSLPKNFGKGKPKGLANLQKVNNSPPNFGRGEPKSHANINKVLSNKKVVVFTFYERHFGKITDRIEFSLTKAVEDYSEPWVLEAMEIAITRDKKSLPYVIGILKIWKRDGKDKNNQPEIKKDRYLPLAYNQVYLGSSENRTPSEATRSAAKLAIERKQERERQSASSSGQDE